MRKQPRTQRRSNPYVITDKLTGKTTSVDMLVYNKGNCGGATIDNPHNRGEQPKVCDHCFAVS